MFVRAHDDKRKAVEIVVSSASAANLTNGSMPAKLHSYGALAT
jgi:hypothetical protein